MGKFKMPSVNEFFKSKRIYMPIKEPVWVYIEAEMKANAAKKPYNTKVGNWLKFLKDLRYHYYREAKYLYNRLNKECGPIWYLEFSSEQRRILSNLRDFMHEDLLEDLPTRVRRCLWDLGITIRFPYQMLMTSMADSLEDPGLFIWILFTKYYEAPPSHLRPTYDLNSMLMMSALVFIDLEECVDLLYKLTERQERPPPRPKKKKSTYFEPKVKYGQYLQMMQVPFYSNHPLNIPKPKRPMPLLNKLHIKSDEDYENLFKSTTFMDKRKQRNVKTTLEERVCNYKFWEPPACVRNVDPETAAYNLKLKMFKMKATSRHLKYKPPYDNAQCLIAGVCYSNAKPVYVLSTFVTLPSGYMLINGGTCKFGDEYVIKNCGMYMKLRQQATKCPNTCNCVANWESTVFDYVNSSKCYCGHYHDFMNTSSPGKDKFFYPPTRDLPLIFDHAKIYQMDALFENVVDAFKVALESEVPVTDSGRQTLDISNLPVKTILKGFLADLAESPLLIPHLPQANLLNNLQEWVRKRVKGNISPCKHKQLMLKSQRRWLDLSHLDYRAQAYFIPFTLKQLENLTWAHRGMVQKLFRMLLKNYEMRTRRNQLEQSRLWWPTMAYDTYPNESFLDVFFTYMPGRYQDTLVVNPYCARTMQAKGGTCPLKLGLGFTQ